ncbi:hypothetical protein [uncultured Sphingomonas sp.]|uniref:hypothetical protein n=1 Tax=uncultured Sphingomonas sp. TaxID=158754 RepID=UPI002584AA97|nr:hypothetical protein [uncultured Sphingomonas sp.]
MRLFGRLPRRSRPPVEPDGFGQSLRDDLRFWHRFRRARSRAVAWCVPTDAERKAIEAHPILGRFGDDTIAVAEVDGERWTVRERVWHGWPDPPRYVFFATAGNTIRAAADFADWPPRWTRPDYSIVTPTTFHAPPS